MKPLTLYIKHVENYTDSIGAQDPSKYGWWILSTDDTEHWDVDGPFATEDEASAALDSLRQELEAAGRD